MQLEELGNKLYCIKFQTQYELCSTFMRLQEFYESPLKQIRGKFFTLEEYMDAYAEARGNFTYTEDWAGFNVPGQTVRKFFKVFAHDLLEKEKRLQTTLQSLIDGKGRFYVLGTYGKHLAMEHELAHGFWHVSNSYKKAMREQIKKLLQADYEYFKKCIRNMHYDESVVDDELQAFMSTSDLRELQNMFPDTGSRKIAALGYQFKTIWKETNDKYGNPE
jgi:hypothetical protein